MELWTKDGKNLMTKEDAWDEMQLTLGMSEFEDYLSSYIGLGELLSWATTQPLFFYKFNHAIHAAYSDYFYSNYYKVEKNETE